MDLVANSVKDPDNIPKEDYDHYIGPFLGRKNLLEIRKTLNNNKKQQENKNGRKRN